MEVFQNNDLARTAFFWIIIAAVTGLFSFFCLRSVLLYQKQWKNASQGKRWFFIFSDLFLFVIFLWFLNKSFS